MLFAGPDLWLVDAMAPLGTRSVGDARKRPAAKSKRGSTSEKSKETCATCGHNLKVAEVLRQYSEEACVHGVHYITKQELTIAERLLWGIAVSVCAVFAVLFMYIAWMKYMDSPIVTRVQTTFYPLYRLPFPAVTVCPSINVRRTIGSELLRKHLGLAQVNETMTNMFNEVLATLSKFQHPFFKMMDEHLKKVEPLMPFLRTLNLSKFMQEVMPPCTHVFSRCVWQGRDVECCDEFHLQRFDGGFCYSFNSLSSDAMSKCEETDTSNADTTEECLLRHNTAYGSSTGLELTLHHIPGNDSLGAGQRFYDGYRLIVHQPNEFPEDGNGLFVPRERFGVPQEGAVQVTPSLTITDAEVRDLKSNMRGCLFPDETHLIVSSEYSLPNCLLECRLRHLAKHCSCLPYYFGNMRIPGALGSCTFDQLGCLSNNSEALRFYRPPERIRGAEGHVKERIKTTWRGPHGIDCSHCLPACMDISYSLESEVTADNQRSNDHGTYIEVYYKDITAVKYSRELAFGKTELLVSMGGIVSLFLGVSLLSAVEVVYIAVKLLWVVSCRVRNRRQRVSNTSPPLGGSPAHHTASKPWTVPPPPSGEAWSGHRQGQR